MAEAISLHRGSPVRILLVEDDRAFREMLADALEMAGFAAVAVSSGEEALRAAASGSFDVLLSDVMMPGMSGVELARKLRGGRPGLVVIFMSGYTERVLREEALLPADSRLLHKPFPIGELEQTIRESWSDGRRGREGE